ncbi:LysR substrate-binding domain-containing protein [Magnetococcus sp. PR-3]|uniref:LysR substrate-binding domain-containing protein n=1 Tax=Magnetococcus sp. PR-3 TaxID=3120355 RepID=UPI002FCE4345
MNGSTYQQLKVFHTITQEGSIRGAARRLHMAPPSVSHALKTLEKHMGLPLFIRTTRRISLTEAGEQLRLRTAPALEELTAAMESVHDLGETPAGKLRITLPRFAYNFLLKPIFATFSQRYPHIEVELSVSDATIDIVEEGIDVGIRLGDRVEAGMVAKPLTPPMRDALFAAPHYLQCHGTPQKPADLHHHHLIYYRYIASNQLAPLELVIEGQAKRIEIRQAVIVNDTDVMVDMAKQGLGMARLLEPGVLAAFQEGSLVPVLEPYWNTRAGLSVYFPQNSQKARRIRVLIDFLTHHAIKAWPKYANKTG